MGQKSELENGPGMPGGNNRFSRKRILQILILSLLGCLLLTTGILLGRVGFLAGKFNGSPIDTIVLSPEQAYHSPLTVAGRVRLGNGTSAEGYTVSLYSVSKYDITDQNGSFFFSGLPYGTHSLVIEGGDKKLAEVRLVIKSDPSVRAGEQLFSIGEDGVWQLSLPAEALFVELDLALDFEEGIIRPVKESVSAMLSDSRVMTYFGSCDASEEGMVLSCRGSLMLTDGTICLCEGGAILPDGTYIDAASGVYKDGKQIGYSALPQGYRLNTKDWVLTTPDGLKVYLNGSDMVENDSTGLMVQRNGRVRLANQAAIDLYALTVKTPGGYVMDADGNVTAPDGKAYGKPNPGDRLPDGTVVAEVKYENDYGVITKDGATIYCPKENHAYIIPIFSPDEVHGPLEGDITPIKPPPPPITSVSDSVTTVSSTSKTEPDSESTTSVTSDDGPGSESTASATTEEDTEKESEATKDPSVTIVDANTNMEWTQISTIDLFGKDGLVYPGASGSYEFYLYNGISSGVKYQITISETVHDAGAIPFEYRLKDKSGYISSGGGKWLTADELKSVWITLPTSGVSRYTLEWRWPFESGNPDAIGDRDNQDVALGNAENRVHHLLIKIHVEALMG